MLEQAKNFTQAGINALILTTQLEFPQDVSSQQVASEFTVVCNEGGKVFKVPTWLGQGKPKGPTQKIVEKGLTNECC